MINWFKSLFKTKKLQKQLDEAYDALKECNGKLVEKQQVINQTNAYWKKKLHEVKIKNKKSL